MGDNQQFTQVVSTKKPRSKFQRNNKITTTFNVGQLVPLQADEILPGDSIDLNIMALIRQTTMIKPVMDGLHLTLHSFFVPMRLVWEDSKFF